MITIVFACVHNAGRSQMAAALFNAAVSPGRARAISAGTDPAPRVHRTVVDVMRERGIDLSEVKPKLITPQLTQNAAWLVTMGCGEACPVVPGARHEDWAIDDPGGQSIERVRAIRNEIDARVRQFIARERL